MNKSEISFSFPQLNIPEKQKDKEWHRKFVMSICKQSLNTDFETSRQIMHECYEFFDGIQSGDDFKFVQETEGGETLPARWTTYNRIRARIETLIGELEEKGYDIDVVAQNKDALFRKWEEKQRLKVEMRMKPIAMEFEEQFGLPLQSPEELPADDEELETETRKDKSERIVRAALKWLDKENGWAKVRKALFRDILIAGRCFIKHCIEDGVPNWKRLDPRKVVFDINATDDYLSDSSYFAEADYMTLADVAEKYNLDKKQLDEVYESFTKLSTITAPGAELIDNEYNSFLQGSTIRYFDDSKKELRVLVVSAYWKDYKKINHKVSKDNYGNEHVKRVADDYKSDDQIKNNVIIWRKATLIGGKIVTDWGECENQPRDIDSLAKTLPPIQALIPNFLNKRSVSRVEQIKSLQQFKDLIMYKLQYEVSKSAGQGFVYDISQLPDQYDFETMMKYLKQVGIVLIDSTKNGIAGQYNQFGGIDLSMSKSVQLYLQISQMLDGEMDAISGINEARQGIVKNASQAVGVTQSALLQSSLSTEPLFRDFGRLQNDVFNYQARLVKIAWAGKEKFAPIIGDAGVNFLAEDVELELDDYAVFVEATPDFFQDKQMFTQFIMTSVQQGAMQPWVAMKFLMEKDIKVAVRKYEKYMTEQMAKQEQQAQQEQMMQQQMAQQQMEAQMQQVQMTNDANAQTKLNLANLTNQGLVQRDLVKGKMDLKKSLINNQFNKQISDEKIKAAAKSVSKKNKK